MAEYCLNADDQTCTGSDSWDNKLRTPPRPRQDIALRDEIPTTQELLRQMVIAATTGTGPVQYAGMTPKGLLKRKRSEAEKKKLAEANAKNDNEDIGPKKKKQKLRFSGVPPHDNGIPCIEDVAWGEWHKDENGELVLGHMRLNDPDNVLQETKKHLHKYYSS